MAKKILVVDDDKSVLSSLEKLFRKEGYDVAFCARGKEVETTVARFRPDVIVLDINLPDRSGLDICEALRRDPETVSLPILMLTGLGSEGDKVLGLRLGADDYLVKPFGAYEILARVEALLRRSAQAVPAGVPVVRGPLRIDPGTREVILVGKIVRLRPKEFELLYLMASHPGQVFTRRQLSERVLEFGADAPSRNIDSQIKNLRKGLGAHARLIETVSKAGYRFNAEASSRHR